MEIPRRTLSGEQVYQFVKILKIPHFRGVLCSDEIPESPPCQEECAILNFQNHTQRGGVNGSLLQAGQGLIWKQAHGACHLKTAEEGGLHRGANNSEKSVKDLNFMRFF